MIISYKVAAAQLPPQLLIKIYRTIRKNLSLISLYNSEVKRMKIDLSTDIENIAYISFLKEQEEKARKSKEEQKEVWYCNSRPTDQKEE